MTGKLSQDDSRSSPVKFDSAAVGTVATSLAGQLALIVSGVIAARLLGPGDRGQLAVLAIVAVVTAFVVSLGLPTAMSLEIARNPSSARACLRALGGPMKLQALAGLVLPAVALFAIFSDGDHSTLQAALVAAPVGLLNIVTMYALGILQGQARFTLFNLMRAAPAMLYALAVLIVYATGEESLMAFSVSFLVANALAVALILVVSLRELPADGGDKADRTEMLRFGVKAQIGVASPMESFQLDQIAVGSIVGSTGLGIYVVGAAFTNLPRFVAQSLGMVAFPRVAARARGGGAKKIARDALISTAVATGVIVVLLELFMDKLVIWFFGSAFEESIAVARVILIGAFCLGMRRVLGDVLRAVDRPLPSSTAEVATWLSFAVIVIPLTQWQGPLGAAIAMACASALGLLALSWMAVVAVRRQASAATAAGRDDSAG